MFVLDRVMRTTRSDALMATNRPKFTVLTPLKIRRKETLFEEFYKITSAQNLTLQGLLRYHGRLRTRKPYLRLAVQLKQAWHLFCGWNKILVSDLATGVGGSNLNSKEWTLLNRFRLIGVRSGKY